jgi:hypothetical protein
VADSWASEAQLLDSVCIDKRVNCLPLRKAHVLCPKARSASLARRALHERNTTSRWCLRRSSAGLTHLNDAHPSTMMVPCAQQPVPEMISFWLCFDVPGPVCGMAYLVKESVWCVLTDLSAAEFVAVHIVAVVCVTCSADGPPKTV